MSACRAEPVRTCSGTEVPAVLFITVTLAFSPKLRDMLFSLPSGRKHRWEDRKPVGRGLPSFRRQCPLTRI